MGLFGKRRNKDEDFKMQLEREAIEKMNSQDDFDYTLPFEEIDDLGNTIVPLGHSKGFTHNAHMITPEEILGKEQPAPAQFISEDIEMKPEASTNASAFLYQKMTAIRKKSDEDNNENTSADVKIATPVETQTENQIEEKPFVSSTSTFVIEDVSSSQPQENQPSLEQMINDLYLDAKKYRDGLNHNVDVDDNIEEKSDETIFSDATTTELKEGDNFSSSVIADNLQSKGKNTNLDVKSAEKQSDSILERLNRYIDSGTPASHGVDTAKYKLESVDSILQGLEKKATEKVLKNHSIAFEKISENTVSTNATGNKKGITELTVSEIMAAVTDLQPTESPKKEEAIAENGNTEKIEEKQIITEEPKVKHHFSTENNASDNNSQTKVIDKTRIIEIINDQPSQTEEIVSGTRIFDTIADQLAGRQTVAEDIFSSSAQNENEAEKVKPEINDYCSVKDRARVGTGLKRMRFKYNRNTAFSFVLFLLSLVLLTPVAEFFKNFGVEVYHIINLALVIIAGGINYDIFKSFKDLLAKKDNNDLPFAISIISVAVYSLVQLITKSEAMPISAVAIFCLLMNNIGYASKYKRIFKNFIAISDETTKNAITILSNKAATSAIVGKAIDGEALLCCPTKTTNVLDFLSNSFCADPNSKKVRLVSFAGVIAAAVSFIIALAVTSGSFETALLVFAGICCVTASPATAFLTNLPLKAAADRLSCYGAMLTGYRWVNRFDNCNAIALDCKELFPDGTIRLIDMKPLSKNPVYNSIVDAIALTEFIGSPLAGMFKQAMDVPTDKTIKVDTVVYEDKMGISGWVNDQKVFIGNRVLLESHGITNLPDPELDKKIMRKGYFPIYLATENNPCVLFVARYLADSEITYELRRLCNTGTTVMVKNCDPNITSKMLCDYFEVLDSSINVMSKQGADQFKLVSSKKESCSAGAVYSKSVCGLLAVLTASIKLKKLIPFICALYVLFTAIGCLSLVVLAILNSLSIISVFSLLIFQAIATLLICLPAIIVRP